MWITMAAYLANFAALLSTRPVPQQRIQDWDSFAQLSIPLCIKNDGLAAPTMAAFYPSVPVTAIGTGSSAQLLQARRRPRPADRAAGPVRGLPGGRRPPGCLVQALVEGTCAAAMAPNTEFQSLFAADASGEYCSLDYVAQPSYMTFSNAIALTPDLQRLPESVLDAFNQAMDLVWFSGPPPHHPASRPASPHAPAPLPAPWESGVASDAGGAAHARARARAGNYTNEANARLFVTRPLAQCYDYFQQYDASVGGSFASLGVKDLAGLFIIQAGGGAAALLIHSGKRLRRRLWRKSGTTVVRGACKPGCQREEGGELAAPRRSPRWLRWTRSRGLLGARVAAAARLRRWALTGRGGRARARWVARSPRLIAHGCATPRGRRRRGARRTRRQRPSWRGCDAS